MSVALNPQSTVKDPQGQSYLVVSLPDGSKGRLYEGQLSTPALAALDLNRDAFVSSAEASARITRPEMVAATRKLESAEKELAKTRDTEVRSIGKTLKNAALFAATFAVLGTLFFFVFGQGLLILPVAAFSLGAGALIGVLDYTGLLGRNFKDEAEKTKAVAAAQSTLDTARAAHNAAWKQIDEELSATTTAGPATSALLPGLQPPA